MLSVSFAFCLCLCGIIQPKGACVAEEYVDLMELNHFYDHQGRLVYDQVIFYEISPETGRFQVRAWCLVEDRDAINRRPYKNYQSDLYQVDWYDSDQRMMRRITSRLYRESWTQVDPERLNKKLLDERMRTALLQHPKKIAMPKEPAPTTEEPRPSTNVVTNPSTTGAIAGSAPSDTLVVR